MIISINRKGSSSTQGGMCVCMWGGGGGGGGYLCYKNKLISK